MRTDKCASHVLLDLAHALGVAGDGYATDGPGTGPGGLGRCSSAGIGLPVSGAAAIPGPLIGSVPGGRRVIVNRSELLGT